LACSCCAGVIARAVEAGTSTILPFSKALAGAASHHCHRGKKREQAGVSQVSDLRRECRI
jgi:hypothetical protein